MGNKESAHSQRTPNYDCLLNRYEKYAKDHAGQKYMTRPCFKECLPFPIVTVSDLFFSFLHQQEVHEGKTTTEQYITKETFIHGLESVLQLTDENCDEVVIKFYYSLFNEGGNIITDKGLREMLNIAKSITLAASYVDMDSSNSEQHFQVTESMIQAMVLNSPGSINSEVFCKTACQHFPKIFSGMQLWINKMLLHKEPQSWSPLPLLPEPSADSCYKLNYDILWGLSTVLPDCYLIGKTLSKNSSTSQEQQISCASSWSLLYSSHDHGQSMNRFKHHSLSYRDPTVMILSTVQDIVLAICVDAEWRDSSQAWGGKDCILVQIKPEFKVIQREEKMIYLNERTRGLPNGLIVGAPFSKAKVSIETDLTTAKLHFLFLDTEIKSIEVWGCGGQEAEEAQRRQQKWEKTQAEKLRKVKLPGKWDENPDKAILEMAGITTSHSHR